LSTVLHTADLHLGRSWPELGVSAERVAALHWSCFENICRLAVERGAAALAISGDLFDSSEPPAKLVEAVRSVFKRLRSEGVTVVIAPGTHDVASVSSCVYRSGQLGSVSAFLEPEFGERVLAERGGEAVALVGLAWDPQETPTDFLSAYRRGAADVPEVMLLHAEVGGGRARRRQDLPVPAGELAAAGADYVALGHRHEHREFRSHGRLWGAYPGTPFGLSFRGPELGPRTACLVSLEAGEEARLERPSTTPAQWVQEELDLGSLDSQDELTAALRARSCRDHIFRVELGGVAGFTPNTEPLLEELAGEFLHLDISDSSLRLSPGSLKVLAGEQSVRGMFARRMRKRLLAARSDAVRAEISAAALEGLRALEEEGG
jgi:DNA repair exonuclease SbcCD nuclease subunit